jgi:type I restriction enzyme M protein
MSNITNTLKSIRNIMRNDQGLSGDAQRLEQLGWMIFYKIFCSKEDELMMFNPEYKSCIPKDAAWSSWAVNDEGITGEELVQFVDRNLFPLIRNLNVEGNRRAEIVRDVFNGNNNYMKSGTYLRQVINKLNEIHFDKVSERHEFGDIYEEMLKTLQDNKASGEFYTPRAITSFLVEMLEPKYNEKILDPACGTGGFLTCAINYIESHHNQTTETLKEMQENIIGWEIKPLPFLLCNTNLILHNIEEPKLRYGDSLDRPLSDFKHKDRVDVIIANPPFGGNVIEGRETNFPKEFQTKESADLFVILISHLLKENGRAAIVLPDGSLTGGGVKARIREKLLTDCNLHTIIRLPNTVFAPYATVATNLLFFTKGEPTKDIWYYEHKLPTNQKAYNKTRPIRLEEFDPIKCWWNNRQESDLCWKVSIDEIKKRDWDLDIKNPTKVEQEHEFTSTEILEQLAQSFVKSQELLKILSKKD